MNDTAYHRKLLIDDLRSGAYTQTMGCLQDETGYCCLGVACDRFMRETGTGEWVVSDRGSREMSFHVGEGNLVRFSSSVMPTLVREWYGFRDAAGNWDEDEGLADKNDCGVGFDDIAAIIEDEPKGLIA